jgi:protein subunit release factor B
MDKPEKRKRWDLDPEALAKDCDVQPVRGGGPGGQHRNKNYTGVRLVHKPSGEVVTATRRRSYTRNLADAFERLTERLRGRMHRHKPRKKTRIPRKAHRKRLDGKKQRSETKSLRKPVGD